VVNFYGGADLRTWRVSPEGEVLVQGSFAKGIDGVIADYVGTADRADPVMAAASPATYADAGDPPILNIHGTADLLVPFEQGKTFHEAATKAGVKSELAVIEGGGHGLSGEMRERSDKLMMDFFDKHLKGIDRAEEARLVEGLYSKRESPVPVQQDIVYAETDGTKLHLDLARPPEGDGPFPLVLCFHGGYYLPNARKDFHREIQDFAEHGYVAASVEYRGIFKGTFPQPVQDGKAALRYLRAHAAEYGIDPARVALWGGSMGGYMALMIGLTGKEDGLDVGDHLDQSSSGQAIIDRYGPTDLQIAETSQMTPERKEMLKASFGTEEVNKELLAKASPITYVDPRDPPVLIIHNPKDTSVPLLQSVALKKALDTAGVPNQMELLRGSWHASELTSKEPGDEADRARARAIELEFLDKYLKRPPNS